jgi:hypothetical protein
MNELNKHKVEKPRYAVGDNVSFVFNGIIINGIIELVDTLGTDEFYKKQPTYDIKGKDKNGILCLFKHIPEEEII